MKTTGAVITEMIEAYYALGAGNVRIQAIAERAGLSGQELAGALEELMGDEDFRAEPEPFGHRITGWDKVNAPVIGGEARHLIRWGE